MAVIKVDGSVGSTFVKDFIALITAQGHEVEFVPVGMAAGQKARYSPLDSFGEVPSVEEDRDFKLPDSILKHEKLTGPVYVKDPNILWSARVVVPPALDLAALSWMELVEKAVVVPKMYPSCVSTVDVHACYKGTLPWLAPRGPRISKLSRTDTAAAAPAPSRPFSFRASLTLSLSVFFE